MAESSAERESASSLSEHIRRSRAAESGVEKMVEATPRKIGAGGTSSEDSAATRVGTTITATHSAMSEASSQDLTFLGYDDSDPAAESMAEFSPVVRQS